MRELRAFHVLARLHPYARCFSSSSAISENTSYLQHPTQKYDSGRLLSRVSGPTDTTLSTQTLGQYWKTLVDKHADHPALIVRHEPSTQHDLDFNQQASSSSSSSSISDNDDCIRWTYAEMNKHVRLLAKGMKKMGLKKGDRIAVLMMNNSEMACLQIATSIIGAILVTLNPSYTAKDLLRSLNHVEATVLFIVPSLRSSDYLSNLQSILPSLKGQAGHSTNIEDEQCPSLKRIILVDNLTSRPKGWHSTSLLSSEGKGFQFALERMNGKAIDYRDVIASSQGIEEDIDEVDLTCHDVINLQFTSGTTGKPKAVALASHNLVNNGIVLGQVMHLTPNDILANIPPLFHCFGDYSRFGIFQEYSTDIELLFAGLTLGNLAAWSAGAAILYASEGFDPVRALRASSEEKATAIHGVPAHFIAELDILRQVKAAQKSGNWDQVLKLGVRQDENWSFHLRTGFTSGSTVPIELMRSIMDNNLLGAKEQTSVYGMTETSPVSFACDTQASIKRRCETVGRVIPHAHAKIVSPDDPDGKPLPIGEIGELCTSGYIVMKGYWNDQKQTNEVLEYHPDEPDVLWMRTGDLAMIDKDGYAEIRGRVKDLIIRGGENITAVEIEK
jgi:acyl-CoA synthetase (AMP-forming)/AMP-acid ligase II